MRLTTVAARMSGAIALAVVALVATTFALDRAVAWLDLGRTAPRSRPNDDRVLVRPEFTVRVQTNALGFREPRLPSAKGADVVRVVAVGDSFTQGFGVAAAQAWPARLEALLDARDPARRHEVIDLGVPGTSPRDYLDYLRDPGLAYAPDLVVVGVMGNDVQDMWLQRRLGVQFGSDALRDAQRDVGDTRPAWRRWPGEALPALVPFVAARWAALHAAGPREAHASGATAASRTPLVPPARWPDVLRALARRYDRQATIDAAIARLTPEDAMPLVPVLTGAVALDADAAAEPYQRIMALVDPRLPADGVLLPPDYDDAWDATCATLTTIARTAARAGAATIFLFEPAVQQVTDAARAPTEARGFVWDPRTLTDTTFADRLRACGARAGATVVDTLPLLRARAGEATYFPSDGHWTAAGHALAAAALLEPAMAALPPS